MSRNQLLNGELEISRITDSTHDEIVQFCKEHYLKTENVWKALNVSGSAQAVAELEAIQRYVLKDNLGYIVRHTKTKEIVGICIVKAVAPNIKSVSSFQKFENPAVIRGVQFLHDMKGAFNIFKEWNIDCAVEIFCLATHKDYGGRGIGNALSRRAFEFARKMLAGNLTPEQKAIIPERLRELKPKAMVSIITSHYLEEMGKNMKLETLAETPFSELFYEGKSFAEHIDPIHKSAKYVGRKL